MIQPLNSNISFRANQPTENKSKLRKVADGAINVVKTFNNVTSTANGFAKGAAEGVVATAICSSVIQNIKDSQGQIAGTVKGIFSDGFGIVKSTIKSIPSLLTKAPLENVGSLGTTVKNFYKNYKSIGVVSTLVGVAILALRTIQGKMKANSQNAEVDHKTQLGHAEEKKA